MTNEEKGLIIAYLADAGELDPEGDVEAHFPGLVPGPPSGE